MSRALWQQPVNNNIVGSGTAACITPFYNPTGLTRNPKSGSFTHTKHKTQTQFRQCVILVLVVQKTVPVVEKVRGEVRVFAGLRLQLRIGLSNL